jgi:hypothetical protein
LYFLFVIPTSETAKIHEGTGPEAGVLVRKLSQLTLDLLS